MNRTITAAVAPEHRHLAEVFSRRQNDGVLASYAQTIRDLAESESIALADVYRDWQTLADQRTETDDLLINGLNHPTAAGHAIVARRLLQLIDPTWTPPALMEPIHQK